MAMTNCAECGNQISTEAMACPMCGRPTEKGVEREPYRLLQIGALVALGATALFIIIGLVERLLR